MVIDNLYIEEPNSSGSVEVSEEDNQLIIQLREIFGKQAKINISDTPDKTVERKEIIVETTLEDGFVEGRQKMVLHMYEPEEIVVQKNTLPSMSAKGFRVSSIHINESSEPFNDFDPIIFIPKKEMDKINLGQSQRILSLNRDEKGMDELARVNDLEHIFEARAAATYNIAKNERIIVAEKLENANDLVVLLHEQSHHDDPNNDVEIGPIYESYRQDLRVSSNQLNMIDDLTKHGMIERWIFVMNNETTADNLVLQKVFRGNKATSWSKVFPQDSQNGYIRLYKALEAINLLGYRQALNGWYVENMDYDQRERLLRFYPPIFT